MNIERLKELRVSKGISQEHLANMLGVKQQTIGKWENGLTVPRLPMLQKIANYFNVTTDHLTDSSDSPHTVQAPTKGNPISVSIAFDTQRVVTEKEFSLLEAYRKASARDKNLVDMILEPECGSSD